AITNFASVWSEKEDGTTGNFGSELHFGTRTHGAAIADRMIIDASGNVGIGTTSPTLGLLQLDKASGNDVDLALNQDGVSHWRLRNAATTGDFGIYNGQLGTVSLAINLSTGNVGIGTLSPSTQFANTATTLVNSDGLGGVGMNWEVTAQGWTAAFSNLMSASGNHNAGVLVKLASSHATDKILDLESGGVNRFRVLGNGYVGIGTPNPQYSTDFVSDSDSYATVAAATLAIGEFTGIHFGYREENTSYRKSGIVFERTGDAAQGKIHILNDIAADDGSMTLSDAKLTVSDDGNVGIGTTSPAAKLTVLESGDVIAGYFFNAAGATSPALKAFKNSLSSSSDPVFSAFNGDAAGTEIFRIEASGNVGIGTASPGTRLHMIGSEDGLALRLDNDGTGGRDYTIESTAGSSGYGQGRLAFVDQAVGARMVIDSSGYVGIGTDDPAQNLQVKGIVGFETTDATNYWAVYAYTDDTLRFNYNGSGNDEVTILSDGKVGIGTSSPKTKLHVNGAGRFECAATWVDQGSYIDCSDYAEMYKINQEELLEPGDVLVIGNNGLLEKSKDAYETRIAGIYSTSPGQLIGSKQGIIIGNSADYSDDEGVPLSLAGRVPVKVTLENGNIEPGDLLTTSSTPGHAMKFTLLEFEIGESEEDRVHKMNQNEARRNSILGKALEPCKEKVCKITALVTLQ
ncbi:MAG: hypothetical protein QGH19_01475, partial [Candidatus Woesearchaeota archaeon]|nr:hypothetical protein [Candidatus Woesearchaeota archaeon]